MYNTRSLIRSTRHDHKLEMAEFEKSFTERAAKELQEKVAAAKAEAVASVRRITRRPALLSQFLD